ncbi:MAG: tripartite tricarboxylate transporter substrate binding protein [Spirochaetaceae bacterium]|jgi:tripartite-type tricarboxylate transporter receptor subunit TctC|nr:tripartite tricarboxylate transporter substrate binding protein [Spirochaetaceae bacterium]
MKKRTVFCVFAALAAIALMGCGASKGSGSGSRTAQEGWKWERKVTLVCPWGVGGGADGTLRPLQPLLQEILGVPVEIVNVEGAGGANGINYTYKQPADGYTYTLATQSIILLDLQKILPFDYQKELTPVAKLVHSTNLLIASKKAMAGKYSNFQELLTYAKAHPQELSCGMLTATGQDSVSMKQTLAVGLGVSIPEVDKYIKTVSYGGGAELSAAMVGGHLTLGVSGAEEIRGLVESGDIVPLIAMSENRVSAVPDVPCTKELGIESYVGSWRAIYARTGTPQAAIDSMAAALKQAWDTPAYQDFMRQNGYLDRSGYANQQETLALQEGEYKLFEQYLKDIGILK